MFLVFNILFNKNINKGSFATLLYGEKYSIQDCLTHSKILFWNIFLGLWNKTEMRTPFYFSLLSLLCHRELSKQTFQWHIFVVKSRPIIFPLLWSTANQNESLKSAKLLNIKPLYVMGLAANIWRGYVIFNNFLLGWTSEQVVHFFFFWQFVQQKTCFESSLLMKGKTLEQRLKDRYC